MPHRLYMLREWNATQPLAQGVRVLGFIKVGEKKLFLYDERGKMHEVTATCVLDFYVHESCQRHGHGRTLFDAMVRDIVCACIVQCLCVLGMLYMRLLVMHVSHECIYV